MSLFVVLAACVAVQAAVVAWQPTPITIGGLVFISLLFVLNLAMYRRRP